MHKMKAEVILRILAQESPKSELQLQRYGEKKLQGPFCNFWKWLGVYMEIFSKPKVLFTRNEDCGLIMDKYRGLFVVLELFYNRK
jgi:hypothetical protein